MLRSSMSSTANILTDFALVMRSPNEIAELADGPYPYAVPTLNRVVNVRKRSDVTFYR